MSLYKNKYRIESTRLEVWDYSKYGYYFVTICTKEKKSLLGNVVEDKVLLNECGKIIKEIWLQIPQQFENVELDEFVIMPNHIHGIIFICKNNIRRDSINRVSTDNRVITKEPFIKNNPMYFELSLGKIIRWFKAKAAYEIHHHQKLKEFSWQPRFYEHIIRNEKSLQQIREYIFLNPLQWVIDDENPNNSSSHPVKQILLNNKI